MKTKPFTCSWFEENGKDVWIIRDLRGIEVARCDLASYGLRIVDLLNEQAKNSSF